MRNGDWWVRWVGGLEKNVELQELQRGNWLRASKG